MALLQTYYRLFKCSRQLECQFCFTTLKAPIVNERTYSVQAEDYKSLFTLYWSEVMHTHTTLYCATQQCYRELA